ncbi:Initiation factor 2 [Helicosporidium sp. ATCC 50920]|nr:Initiation factor 2 [Helicosporidium sp. ATCC 50920]|eukprot:KDD76812.1 Initiation factor 2 [Helicosporidium sp. ATCC 50920]
MMMSQGFYDRVEDFAIKLRQRRVGGSIEAATGTAELLRQLVTSSKVNDPQALIDEEIDAEREDQDEDDLGPPTREKDSFSSMGGLSRAFRSPYAIGKRTLSLHTLLDQDVAEEIITSMNSQNLAGRTSAAADRPESEKKPKPSTLWARKQEVIDGVNDLIEELKDIDSSIAGQHIYNNEVILTFGYSRTVLQFLKRAKEKRDFQVVVAEAYPSYGGHKMASELASLGIQTTAIPDATVYAMMGRVNKVVVTAHALLADGGVMAPIGMQLVAMAAKRHAVPFVVLVGIYKLTPQFPHEPGLSFNEMRSPAAVLPFLDESLLDAELTCEDARRNLHNKGSVDARAEINLTKPYLQIHNPSFDYVPPKLISLFVTDQGHGFMPSYVYRQLFEWYHKADW